MKTYSSLRLVMALAALAVVAWSTLAPHPPSFLPRSYDKIGHFTVFALCAFVGGCAFIQARRARWSIAYWALCYLLAIFLEYAQGWWLPGRTFDMGDLQHNLMGVSTALALWLIVFLVVRKLTKKRPEDSPQETAQDTTETQRGTIKEEL